MLSADICKARSNHPVLLDETFHLPHLHLDRISLIDITPLPADHFVNIRGVTPTGELVLGSSRDGALQEKESRPIGVYRRVR